MNATRDGNQCIISVPNETFSCHMRIIFRCESFAFFLLLSSFITRLHLTVF